MTLLFFNFGDSISDTGNLLISGASLFQNMGKLPYGQTFFGRPTGRCSDGRLVVDFLAKAFGLPYFPPYLALTQGSSQNYRHGVNFAVAGATAHDQIKSSMWTNDSLSVQLGWFKKTKLSLCASEKGCESFLKKSLFLVSEIGGNDYNYPFFTGETIKQVEALIPPVVEAITNAIIESILMACCGGIGQHNYNPLVKCGSDGSTVCKDPSSYANWDGVHFTEAAYRIVSEGFVSGVSDPSSYSYSSSPMISDTVHLFPAKSKAIK